MRVLLNNINFKVSIVLITLTTVIYVSNVYANKLDYEILEETRGNNNLNLEKSINGLEKGTIFADYATGVVRNGLICIKVRKEIDDNTKYYYGYINTDGKMVIPAIYEEAKDFENGIAPVKLNGKWGIIDKSGKTVVQFKYDNVKEFSEGLLNCSLNGKWGAIDSKGKVIIPFEYEDLFPKSDNLIGFKKNKKFGFINTNNKIVIEPKYDDIINFSENIAGYKLNGKWGIINKIGQKITEPLYDSLGAVKENKVLVSLNNKYGFIDNKGREVIPIVYDYANNFSDGMAIIGNLQENNKLLYGFIDSKGTEVIPIIYDKVTNFTDGIASVYSIDSGISNYIDKDGNIIFKGGDIAQKFSEGLSLTYNIEDKSKFSLIKNPNYKGIYEVYQNDILIQKCNTYDDALKYAKKYANSSIKKEGYYDIIWDSSPKYEVYQNANLLKRVNDFSDALEYAKKYANSSIFFRTNGTYVWDSDFKISNKYQIKNVPYIGQYPELFRGCEVTSLAMLLNYKGVPVDKMELAKKIKKEPFTIRENGKVYRGNPHKGFVGDIYSEKNKNGYGVYNEPIYELANEYLKDRVINLTGVDFNDLYYYINQNCPVWIITNSRYSPLSSSHFSYFNTKEGKVKITYKEHSVLITGYDEKYIYYNDPMLPGYTRKQPKNNFIKAWEQMGSQAITCI